MFKTKKYIVAIVAIFVLVSCNREITISPELGNHPYFYKTYLNSDIGLGCFSEQLGNGDILVVSSQGNDTRTFNSIAVRKVDAHGTVIWEKSIKTITDVFAQGTLLANGDLFIMNRWATSEIIRINQDGEIVFQREFSPGMNENYLIAPPVELPTGEILVSMTNGLGSGSASLNYLITLNSDGSVQKANKFEDTNFGGKILMFNVLDFKDDYYTVSGCMFEYPWTGWGNPIKPFCSKVRQGFQAKLTVKYSGTGESAFMRHAFATDDGGAICVTSAEHALIQSVASPNNSFGVVRYDKDMNEVWEKTFKWDVLTLEPYSLTTNAKKEIIISGSCSKAGSTSYLPFVVTLNQNGEVLFQKIFQFTRSAELFDAKHLENNDYILTGLSYGFGESLDNVNTILIKTDAEGNFQ